MKTLTINIDPKLKNINFSVDNGAAFLRSLILGELKSFTVVISNEDIIRVKKFAIKYGNDKSSNKGHWYAHCNGYSMDLQVDYNNRVIINTYRPYGKSAPYIYIVKK